MAQHGANNQNFWQGLTQSFFGGLFAGSPRQAIESGIGTGMSLQDQEAADRHRREQMDREASARRDREDFGARFVGEARFETGENLRETLSFFSPTNIGARFQQFAAPTREAMGEQRDFARDRLIGPQGLEAGFRGLESGFAGLEREGRAGAADLVAFQEARERDLIGQLEGLGDQERLDINRGFAAQGQVAQQRLGRMGLAGTSAATSAAIGTQQARTSALGRFEERIRGERLGLSERLSGETLQARAGELEFGLGLGRDTLAAQRETLGVSGDITQYLTGLDTQQIGQEQQLGMLLASLQEMGLGNRNQARLASLLPFEIEEQYLLGPLEDQTFDRVQYLPPNRGGGGQLMARSGTIG